MLQAPVNEIPQWLETVVTFIIGGATVWLGLVKSVRRPMEKDLQNVQERLRAEIKVLEDDTRKDINGIGERIASNRTKIDRLEGQMSGLQSDIMAAINANGQATQRAVHELEIKVELLAQRLDIDELIDKAFTKRTRKGQES